MQRKLSASSATAQISSGFYGLNGIARRGSRDDVTQLQQMEIIYRFSTQLAGGYRVVG